MMQMVDFEAPVQALQRVVVGVTDAQLDDPTPCEGRRVGQLLQHIVGLSAAFRAAADKDLGEWTDSDPDASGWPELEDGWREALSQRLPALVEAWRSPDAWQAMTRAGGVDLPGDVAGLVGLDEVVLHGWDLARATDQEYTCDDSTAHILLGFVEQFDPQGTPGVYGPAVAVDHDAPVFDRVLARAGRDPQWSAP
jgi:uncharacterized protein (TIGR03086 family)